MQFVVTSFEGKSRKCRHISQDICTVGETDDDALKVLADVYLSINDVAWALTRVEKPMIERRFISRSLQHEYTIAMHAY